MKPANNLAFNALQQAKLAVKQGDKRKARRWAEKAASIAPDQEEPWLILAALGSPRASVAYLQKALEINPESPYAREGMHWAIKRIRHEPPLLPPRQLISTRIQPNSFLRNRPALLPWFVIFILVTFGSFIWFSTPTLSFALNSTNIMQFTELELQKSTYTPTTTPTLTPTSTPTPTVTPSSTPTATLTATNLPSPTDPPQSERKSSSSVNLPPGVNKGEFWIDVDLTRQKVYAYQGKNLLSSFSTSTGTWQHPTVTGQYKIYVKYRYAHMSGPGYFLPNVPYVMYFYKGYGIHGTYWHNNFGTPMSHGCVNLRTEDAGWVYNWASIGTIVNIHY